MIFSYILNRKTCRVYDIGINSLYSQVASRGSLYLYVYLKKEYDGKQEIRDSIRLRFVRRGGMRLCRYLLAARRLPSAGGNGKMFRVVNPRFCMKNETCAFYRDATPIVYARGFTRMQKRMLPDQYDKFSWKLIPHFGRNPYYERRNGKRVLPPDEQELIAYVAGQVGVTEEFKFDKYEYRYNWKD